VVRRIGLLLFKIGETVIEMKVFYILKGKSMEPGTDNYNHDHSHSHSHGHGDCRDHDHNHGHGHCDSQSHGHRDCQEDGQGHNHSHSSHDHHRSEDTSSAEAEERAHWIGVMRTLVTYEDFVLDELDRRHSHLNKLPKAFADRLPDSTFAKLQAIADAAKNNQHFMEEAVRYYSAGFYRSTTEAESFPGKYAPNSNDGIPAHQQHRNEAVLHSLFREWSAEGKEERDQSFAPIVRELQRLLPVDKRNCYKQRVLVPGSGLAR
jgi:hypothetical protein